MKLLLPIFFILIWGNRLYAASFNFEKAKTKIELLICEKHELSELDSQLAYLYDKSLISVKNIDLLKSEQRLWLKNTRDKCLFSDCLISAYQKRIKELSNVNIFDKIKPYKVTYLRNGKIKLRYGNKSKTLNLSLHIPKGCEGYLYYKSIKGVIVKEGYSKPEIAILSVLNNSGTATLLLLASTAPNCNVQGFCGAGANTGFIALTVTNKLDIVYLNSFKLDDCYSFRFSKYYEDFNEKDIKDMLPVFKAINNNQLKVEFTETDGFNNEVTKQVIFDMTKPEKGFIVERLK